MCNVKKYTNFLKDTFKEMYQSHLWKYLWTKYS